MAFHLGSLGFLTPFKFDNFQEQVNAVLEGEKLSEDRTGAMLIQVLASLLLIGTANVTNGVREAQCGLI